MRGRVRLARLCAALTAGTLMLAAAAETREPAGTSNARAGLAAAVDGGETRTWRPFLTAVEAHWLVFRLKQGDERVFR